MHHSVIRLPEVEKRTGYKRTTIYQKIKNNEFPAPIKMGIRAVGWLESEIDAWLQSRIEVSRADTGGKSHAPV